MHLRRRAPSPALIISSLLVAAVGLVPIQVALAPPAAAAPGDVRINEIITNSDDVEDAIELTNVGAEAVDVSGWILKDDDDTRTLAIAAGTTLAPGGFLAVTVDGPPGGFGLGNGDSARVYLPDATTLIDQHSFPGHSDPSWSRCPDGTGAFAQANAETLGGPNDCPDVADLVLNEVESSGDPVGDWVEIANPTGGALDASGLVVKDGDDTHALPVPAGTVVPAGGHAAVYTEPDGDPAGFGLGGADSARLFTADGATLIDSYAWTDHATTTYGRCPDALGDFAETAAPTRGEANACVLPGGAADVRVNEIITDSDTVEDAIELTNVGAEPVDVSGFVLKDEDDSTSVPIAAGTVLPPNGFLAFSTDVGPDGFGLGNGDSARVFLPDGLSLVDGHTFPSHSDPSWSRCPDGTGAFVQAQAETLGAPNACVVPDAAVRLNEVESDDAATDWVEVVNTGTGPVDLSGWVVRGASDAAAVTIASGTEIPSGAYLAVDVGFGLGDADQARLFAGDATTLIDSFAWTGPAETTYGRCPDGVGDFTTTLAATRAAANDCPVPEGADALEINEVKTNPNPDFVEIRNVSDALVDVSDFTVADSSDEPVAITTESTPLAPGALFAFNPDLIPGGFGLGAGDNVTIQLSDGVTVVDSYAWTSHRIPSYGICPGADEPVENVVASPGSENVCAPVRINEIESDEGEPGDWVELVNVGAEPVDVSGWVLRDAADDHGYPIPATSIAPGGYLVVEESALGFGLGDVDSVRLFAADASTLVDSYAWTEHAATTYGRCPDATGDLDATEAPSKGAANLCPPPFFGVETEPWPGSPDVTESDPLNAFVSEVSSGDVSGLAFDPVRPGVLWAIKNKNRLFKLTKVGGLWTPLATDGWATGKELRFADGAGEPDTEGVTVGADGAIYATSERDNLDDGVPRNTVLRYDVTGPEPTLTATDEWNLDADFPELATLPGGSNLGLEGLTRVPDDYLVDGGFVDESTGTTYDPGDYPGHGGGLFFLALENDGNLYAYALAGAEAIRVAVVESGFATVMDTTYDPERERVWAVCDDTCEGQVSLLDLGADGRFAVDGGFERPTGMPNLNNEGFAIAPRSTCLRGFKEVVWADDAGTGGHSLRSGTLPCTDPVEPVEPVAPTVSVGDASVVYGRVARMRVAVTAAGTTPSGTVTLSSGGVPLGSATLSDAGTATIRVPAQTLRPRARPYPVRVRFTGDAAVAAGTASAELRVRKGSVRLSETVRPKQVRATRKQATVLVRIANPDGVAVRGRVTVSGSGIRPRAARVERGRVRILLPVFERPGRRQLVIRYGGSQLLLTGRTVAVVRVVGR